MAWMFIGFVVLVLALLALDLGVFNRKAHEIKVKEALGWSAFWISLGLAFSVFIYFGYENHWMGLGLNHDLTSTPRTIGGAVVYNEGSSAVTKYITGYLVEKSLAIDNIFVIAVVFASFAVPAMYQHRVLFWGIIGALVLRGVMIGVGAAMLNRFSWIIYVFGGFLIITGIKMLLTKEATQDPGANFAVRLIRRWLPVTDRFHGQHFLVRAGSDAAHEAATPGAVAKPDIAERATRAGKMMVTPLLLALVIIEFTDVLFAVDSIPAIFVVTGDSFLVFTSNVMAMLGLRSLYFALAGMMQRFRYLKISLAAILVLVGGKMLAHSWLKPLLGEHFNLWLLGAIMLILGAGIISSLVVTRHETHNDPATAFR